MPDLITRAKSVPVPIAKFHYRNPPSPQLQHKSPFGQRSKSSGSSGCLRTVTCWHLSNHLVTLAVRLGAPLHCLDADTELHPSILRDGRIALGNLVLYLDAASNGLNDAWELRDDAVPCAAEDMTAMGGDRLLDHSTVHAEGSCGGFFVKLG